MTEPTNEPSQDPSVPADMRPGVGGSTADQPRPDRQVKGVLKDPEIQNEPIEGKAV